ncbi:MAG: type II toxin-antitoxin system RelB/DinJ family antitoxin [Bilifractor sp.]|jgi:DNA-damage-inducible protein J
MAQVNVRIDDNVKKEAEEVLDEMGMPMTTAVTIFLKTVARERRIPFEITADPFYSDYNMRYLEQKMTAYKKGTLKTSEHSLIED